MTRSLRREIQVPIYWLVVGLMVMVCSPILSIIVSVKINQRTFNAAQEAQQAAKAEATLRYCRLLGSQVDVYSEATTAVGKDAYNTWLTEYRLQGCEPRR
jgi:hypothetical protein